MTQDNPQENSSEDNEEQAEQELKRIEMRVAWRKSPEYRRLSKQTAVLVIAIILLPLALLFITWPSELSPGETRGSGSLKAAEALSFAGATLLALVCFGGYAAFYLRLSSRRSFSDAQRVAEARRRLHEAEDVAEASEELELSALWRATQKRLDYYHEIATTQAEKSFRHSQWAIIGGFAVLILSVVIAAFSRSIGGAIAAGAIGTAGAGLAGYLGKTFLRTQEKTSNQLQSYFGQPLVFSQYLAAERLLDMLDGEQKAESVQDLIRSMASPNSLDELQSNAKIDQHDR
ncbi:hypothetical protein ABZ816_29525 [Actinosynnema sp. NPDC047251]|uniref:Cyanobacterial TRADD-N associated 2 transmembrane domain-containing protein n=1 Tax=Saccharothrix espanaensis (strain ATCC 51144 / DSM 44229 / JCM 9112 / NBRC 15066 / NRRL 15764) TaxID=1179773 RepID=K0K3F4_SACES|nr:hypothetical protein [Saccharothrix espanaensis]CCH34780.1 hypothetical protein BN6_75550 [Saccharothrix espanaensis DSM 44229]